MTLKPPVSPNTPVSTDLGIINVYDYGARGDGVTDDTTAVQAAIAALPTLSGRKTGKVLFAANKTYRISSTLNLDDTSGVTLECEGGGVSADGGRPMLKWLGGAGSGSLITAKSSYGLHLRNLTLAYSNAAYDGDLIKFGWSASAVDSFYPCIERCYIAGVSGANSARSLVNLDKSIIGTIRECQFIDAVTLIRGVDTSYAIAWNIQGNVFNRGSTASIYNVGEGWHIHGGNAFEGRSDHSPAGIINDPAVATSLGVVIDGNWFGDITAGVSGAWIDIHGRGIAITGNRLHIETDPTSGTSTAVILRGCLGVTISGNNFSSAGSAVGIDFQQYSAANCDGVVVQGNRFTSIVPTANPSNVTSGQYIGNVGLSDRRLPGTTSVTSAATIAVPAGVDLVTVTGTTNITSVTAGTAGQRVTLVFSGVLTFTDGSNLKLAGNFVTTADDTITLVCDGVNWIEASRSVN